MKLKQSSDKFSLQNILVIFLVPCVLGIVMRAYQMVTTIDFLNGFFKQNSVVNIAIYLVVALGCIALAVTTFMGKDTADFVPTKIKSKPLAIITIVFAALLIGESIATLTSAMLTNGEGHSSYNFASNLASDGGFARLMQGIFELFAGVYFIKVGEDFKNGTNKSSAKKILALTPAVYMGLRLMTLFVKQISFLKVSDLVFELFMTAFMLVFYINFAQVNSNIYRAESTWKVFAWGLNASLIALVISVPRFILTFVKNGMYIVQDYTFKITDLMFAVFVILMVFTYAKMDKTQVAKVEEIDLVEDEKMGFEA